MPDPDGRTITWITSSRSGAGNSNCVQVGICDEHVILRDSKDPDGPVLTFDREVWRGFIAWVKHQMP